MTRFSSEHLLQLAEQMQALSTRHAGLAKMATLHSSPDSKSLANGYRADADTLASAAEALTGFSNFLTTDCQERSETEDTQR